MALKPIVFVSVIGEQKKTQETFNGMEALSLFLWKSFERKAKIVLSGRLWILSVFTIH